MTPWPSAAEDTAGLDKRQLRDLQRLDEAWSASSSLAWWVVDREWTELRSRGGATDRLFGLGPLDGVEALYRCIPAEHREGLWALADRLPAMARCVVLPDDGGVRLLAVTVNEISHDELIYAGIDITEHAISDLDRELAEHVLAGDPQPHLWKILQGQLDLPRTETAIAEAATAATQEAERERLSRDLDDTRRSLADAQQQVVDLRTELAAVRSARQRTAASLQELRESLVRLIHDVRAPLNTIMGFTELIGDGESDPQRTRWLDHMRAAGNHLLGTAEQLLELARAGSANTQVSMIAVRLLPIVSEALSVVHHETRRRRLDIDVDLPEDLEVIADPRLLSHVITNLVSNAVTHTPPHGQIAVEAHVAGPLVSVRFTDTGPGIPPDMLDTIFDAFHRGSPTDSTRPGTGLGLAICREHVEAMRGAIGATNAPGAGATFWVDLPGSTPATSSTSRPLLMGAKDLGTVELLEQTFFDHSPRIVRSPHALVRDASRRDCAGVLVHVDLVPPAHLDALVADLRAALDDDEPIVLLTPGPTPTPAGATGSIQLPASPTELRVSVSALGIGSP